MAVTSPEALLSHSLPGDFSKEEWGSYRKEPVYRQPTMIIPLYPDLPVKYKMNRKHNGKKEQPSIWFPFFLLSNSPLIFPLVKLVWMAIVTL